jgi:hypothetical protein
VPLSVSASVSIDAHCQVRILFSIIVGLGISQLRSPLARFTLVVGISDLAGLCHEHLNSDGLCCDGPPPEVRLRKSPRPLLPQGILTGPDDSNLQAGLSSLTICRF